MKKDFDLCNITRANLQSVTPHFNLTSPFLNNYGRDLWPLSMRVLDLVSRVLPVTISGGQIVINQGPSLAALTTWLITYRGQ